MEIRDKRAHKAHIEAAQNWLGKAASSLEAENEIRSDLHLMLAEAELYRAKRRSLWRRGAAWALPPLVAIALVAAGYALFIGGEDSVVRTSGTSVAGAGTQELLQENQNFAGKTADRVETFKDGGRVSVTPVHAASPIAETVPSAPVEHAPGETQQPRAEMTDRIEPAASAIEQPNEERRVPDTDVQQLMQSAAVILRQ